MSQWFDNSANANKLRQSYLKGFLDISGGGILVRADNSLNFYTASGFGNDITKPSFALEASTMKVVNPSDTGNMVSVPTTKLGYIYDLEENVKAAFADIRSHFTGSAATSTTALAVASDANIGGNLQVGGNAKFDQQVSIAGNLNVAQNLITKGNGFFGGNLEVAGNEIINMNLYVKGDTFLNGRLFVTQDASFHANIASYGQILSLGHLITAQDVSAGGNLLVSGSSTLKNKVTVTAGGLEVTGADTKLHSTLTVDGTTTLTSAVTINSSVAVNADNSFNFYTSGNANPLFSLGPSNFKVVNGSGNANYTSPTIDVPTSNLSYITDLNENVKAAFAEIRGHFTGASETSTSALNVTADAKIGGNLQVGGNAQFDQQVSIAGNLNIAQNLITKGNGFFGGNLEVAGNEIINMNLYVKGDTFLHGRLFVTQDASFHANISSYGQIVSLGHLITAQDVSAGGNLLVSGVSTLKGKATITAGGLEVTGADTKLHSTLTVDGNATLSSNLSVVGNSTTTGNSVVSGKMGVANTLDVSGATALQSTLDVTGKANFLGDASFNSNITLANNKTFTTGLLNINGNYGNEPQITTTSGNLVIGASDLSHCVHITSNLIVDGSINFLGTITQTNVNIQVSDELDISSNGDIILKATQQAGTSKDIAAFYNSVQAAPVLMVGKNNSVAVNKASADMGVSLDVNGNTQISGDLSLNSTLHVAQKITANNDMELTTGNLKVTTGSTDIRDLKVNTTSVFTGVATFNAGIVLGDTFIDQSTYW